MIKVRIKVSLISSWPSVSMSEVILARRPQLTSTGMNLLEEKKDHIFVVPAINWLWATLYEAAEFGYTTEHAEKVGYKRELEVAVAGLREMHKRGILVLPGG
jgi:hypothetical protein